VGPSVSTNLGGDLQRHPVAMPLKPLREISPELSCFLERKSASSVAWRKLLNLLRRIYYCVRHPTVLVSGSEKLFRFSVGLVMGLVNYVVCFFYKCTDYFNKSKTIKSVLHVGVISHKAYMLSRGLRRHGIRSLSIGYDYNLPYHISSSKRKLLGMFYLWKVFAKYDVIHYHFCSFLTTDASELKFLKALGKVIVFHYRGCDLRQRSINLMKNPGLNCCQECDYVEGSCETDYHYWRLGTAKKYGDLFFVTTPDLQDFMAEAEQLPFILPTEIDLDAIRPAEKDNSLFRVVTSSNHHGIDGTTYVRSAVKRLRDEGYPLELMEVHGVSYKEALAVYKSADLFVGKLLMGFYNNAVIECMLLGVPCMCYIRDEFLANIPDCPIIVTRPETVYENLREYITKEQLLKEIGNQGVAFVRKHHDPDMVVQLMIDRYNQIYQYK
jgi:hypothetical protein